MAKSKICRSELLAKHDEADFLRGIAETVLKLIMEPDDHVLIATGRCGRNGERTIWRYGFRQRALDTRLGALNLRVLISGGTVPCPAFWRPTRPRDGRWL